MPILAKSSSGTVTGLWGSAFLKLPNGKLKPLELGDHVKAGAQIITTQDGIVQITNGNGKVAVVKPVVPASDLDRTIAALEEGDEDTAAGAGLTGGAEGGLQPGLRVDRVSESVGQQSFEYETTRGNGFVDIGGNAPPLRLFEAEEVLPAPSVGSVSSPTATEGSNLDFTVNLTGTSTIPTTVTIRVEGGTATLGTDTGVIQISTNGGNTFVPATVNPDGTITVSVPANTPTDSIVVRVPTTVDNISEGPETVTVTAGTPQNTTPAEGTGTIQDGNGTPTITTVEPGAPGAGDDAVPEGTSLVYAVTLSNPSSTATSFSFTLGGGSADTSDYGTPTFSNGVTYNASTGQITVPAGVTGFSVTVPTLTDSVSEQTETVPLVIGGVTGTGAILDGNGPPTITSVEPGAPGAGDDAVPEGTDLVYTVTLSNPSTTPTSYPLTLGGGSASTSDYGTPTFSNGVTYDPATGQVTVPAGVTEFAVTVPTVSDTISEQPETVPLTIGGVTGTGTIEDGTGLPLVAINDLPQVDEGSGFAEFTITLSNPSSTDIVLHLSTKDGQGSFPSATAPSDYTAITNLEVVIKAGETSATVRVPIINDDVLEGPERFQLEIVSHSGNVEVGKPIAEATIIDFGNPEDPTDPTFDNDQPLVASVSSPTVVEGQPLEFVVSLSKTTIVGGVVQLTLSGVSADLLADVDQVSVKFPGGDYAYVGRAADGTFIVEIPQGTPVDSLTVQVTTLDDTLSESSETLTLEASTLSLTTETWTAPQSGTGTITDNDGTPTITRVEPGVPGTGDDAVVEGNNLVYNVTLSNGSDKPTSFSFTLGGGSATPADYGTPTFSDGVTYDPATGKITVPAGVTEFSVTVPTTDDSISEPTETVPLTIGGVTGTGSIIDNDGTPTIKTVEPGQPGVADDAVTEGSSLVYNVALTNTSSTPVSYSFTLGGATASSADIGTPVFSNGVTYDAATGKITVPAGVADFTVTVPTVDDTTHEQQETLPLTIGGVTGTGLINDNDDIPTITTVEPGVPGVGGDEVIEGGSLVYNVALSNASSTPVSYSFTLGGGTALSIDIGTPTFSNGVTYDAATGKITVPADVTSFTVTVPTIDDTVKENSETLPLTVGGVTGTGIILDNDGNPTIQTIEPGQPGVADDAVTEGVSLVYNVTLTNTSSTPVSYSFTLGGGSAVGADFGTPAFSNGVTYDAATGKITVPADVASFTVTVPTVDDAIYEQQETLPLTIGGVTGTGLINDNDGVPTIKTVEPGQPGVADDAVTEGTSLVYNVSLTHESSTPVSYSFTLGGGSASAGDIGAPAFSNGVTYDAATGKITVPAGVTGFTVTVPTVDDTISEPQESVPLTIGGVTGTGLINDNDGTPTIKTVEPGQPGVSDDAVVEGTSLVYNVSLTNTSSTPVSYSFTLGGGTASSADIGTPVFSNGVTFDAATGKITVPAGVAGFTVTVPTVDDTISELPESVPLTIGGVTGLGVITDNDGVPTIKTVEPGQPGVGDDAVTEGTSLVYNVSLTNAASTPTLYTFALGGGSASSADFGAPVFSNGVTYSAVTGRITVPAGVTSFSVTVPTVDDTISETQETVPLSIGGVTGTGLINDNDGTPTIKTVEPGQPGVGDDAVTEGTSLVYNVALTNASSTPTSYSFTLGGGSASASDIGTPTFSNGVTYDAATGKITVPAGVTGFTVTVPTTDDVISEPQETVPLTIGGVTGTGLINDNDGVPTIKTVEPGQPGVADDEVTEGTSLVYNVALTNASSTPTSYSFTLGGGSASAGDIGTPTFSNGVTYDAATGKITVPAGVTGFTVTVPTVDDTVSESQESVPLTIGGVTGTGLINDNDGTPTIKTVEPGQPGVGDDAVTEGTSLVYNVSLTNTSATPVSYSFTLGGGTASSADIGTPVFSNGVTYDAATGKITVPAGVAGFTVTVPTVDDTISELPESVPLTIGGVTGTGVITDNDGVPTIKTVEPGQPGVGDDAVTEGTSLVYNVSLTNAASTPTLYTFALGGGSASSADFGTPVFSNGVTYSAVTGRITVPAGVTSFSVTVPTVDDTISETQETVPLSIGGVTGTGLINDNDGTPTIKTVEPGQPGVGDDAVTEGTSLVYNVALTNASSTPTSYSFTLGGGSASAGDIGTPTFSNGVTYDAATGKITVPAGVTGFTVTVPTVDDTVSESQESVPLTIGGVTGTGLINDNDGTPTIKTVEPGQPGVGDDAVTEGTSLVYNVALTNASSTPTSYSFTLGGGSASAGDIGTPTFSNGVTYDAVTGKITVPAGVTGFTVTVPTTDDVISEPQETVPLTIGGVTGTGLINDNDGTPTITKVEPGQPGVGDDAVVEGNNLVYTVSLSNVSATPTSYAFTLGGGSASASDIGAPVFSNGVTYDAATGKITVPAGVTGFTVTVPTINDTITENTETVPLTIGGVTGTGAILDNDAPPAIDLDGNNSSGATGTGYNTAYTEKGAPVRLSDVDVTVTDVDSTQLTGATIKLVNPHTGDVLSVIGNLPSGITATVNGAVVTLSGAASLAAYQTAIHEIGFASTSNNPSTEARSVEVTVTDGTSNSNTAVTTIQVTAVNDAPTVVSATSGSVSEEGLANGIADTTGSPDTTNAVTTTGKIVVADADGDATTISLSGPSGIKTLDNVEVVWVSDGQGGLIGKAGAAANAATVATLTMDAGGNYAFTLKAPLMHSGAGEDALSLNFGVNVNDGKGGVGTGSFTISVEDDAPSTAVSQVRDANVVDTNLMIVLDTSGSMNTTDGINGTTRLASAIQSITTLLDKYDALGDVKVRLVTFSTHASAVGTEWTTVAAAKQLLATLASQAPTGGTNYDEALSDAMAAFNSTGKLTNGQNVSYFISDGEPTYGSGTTSQLVASNVADPALNGNGSPGQTGNGAADLGIQANEEALWKTFLTNNQVDSYALGVGGLTTAQRTFLDPIAYDGRSVSDRNGVIVSAFAQLDGVLADTIPTPVSGNLLSGSFLNGGAGADGPAFIKSLVVNGVTYTYDPANGGSIVVSGGASAGVFDTTTDTLTITTKLADGSTGGKFIVDMDGGDYRYEVPPAVPAAGVHEVLNFMVSDRDGDTTGSSLTINVSKPNIINGTTGSETLTGTAGVDFIAGGDGNDTLLGNDGDDKLYGNNGDDNLQGGAGHDLLSGGAGNDVLLGGDGNDTLIGGVGNDVMTGGLGSDVFQWNLADAGTGTTAGRAVDTIKDFNVASASSGGDVLDLRDLLSGENTTGGAGNLQNYLDFDTTSTAGSTIIRVSPTGGFSGGTYTAGNETQRIVLEGVDIRSGLGLANNASDTQIITKLLQDGKLLVDNS